MSSSTAGYTCHSKRNILVRGHILATHRMSSWKASYTCPSHAQTGVNRPSSEQALLQRERAWQQQRGAVEYPYLPCLRALSKREGLKLVGMSSNESLPFKFIAGRAPTTIAHSPTTAAARRSFSLCQHPPRPARMRWRAALAASRQCMRARATGSARGQ